MTDPFSSTAAAAPHAPDAEVSRRELNASFHQCVLVLVHTVLYHRRVYPAASFRLVRYAGLAVWQSRHPGVCAWVRTMVESAMQVINKDRVRERYTLALTAFMPAAESVGGDNSGPAQAGGDRPEVLLWGSVKQEYRSLLATTASFLQTHSFSEPRPSPSSSSSSAAGLVGTGDERGEMRPNVFKDEDGCRSSNDDDGNGRDDWSFSVTVEVPAGSTDLDAEVPADFPWVSSDSTTLSARTPNPHRVHGDRVHPIRYTDLGPLQFNFYMEETDL